MLFQWNVPFICILFLLLNLQFIESHYFRYLTNPNSEENNKPTASQTPHTPTTLKNFKTPKKSPIRLSKQQKEKQLISIKNDMSKLEFNKYIDNRMEFLKNLITNTENEWSENSWSLPALHLQKILNYFSRVPPILVATAYELDKKEALSLFLEHKEVVFDL